MKSMKIMKALKNDDCLAPAFSKQAKPASQDSSAFCALHALHVLHGEKGGVVTKIDQSGRNR